MMTKEDKDLSPYEVFDGTAWEAGLLKSILEDNDIETILEQITALPWNILPTTGASAKVFVALKDFEKAKAIVGQFSTNMEKENSNGESE